MALLSKRLPRLSSNMEMGFEAPFLTKNHQAGVRKGTGFFVD